MARSVPNQPQSVCRRKRTAVGSRSPSGPDAESYGAGSSITAGPWHGSQAAAFGTCWRVCREAAGVGFILNYPTAG